MECSSPIYHLCLRYIRDVHDATIHQIFPDHASSSRFLNLCLQVVTTTPPLLRLEIAIGQYLVYSLRLSHGLPGELHLSTHIVLCELRLSAYTSGLLLVRRADDGLDGINWEEYGTQRGRQGLSTTARVSHGSIAITSEPFLDIRHWLGFMILQQSDWYAVQSVFTRFQGQTSCLRKSSMTDSMPGIVSKFCSLFERTLLFRATPTDFWLQPDGGRSMFLGKLSWFVQRGIPVRFALPAFPCKSSNTNKTGDTLPNGGEYEALDHLHKFCYQGAKIYRAGCVIDIVSDGHVFSDCIGVHDDVVSNYSARLRTMSCDIHRIRSCVLKSNASDPIKFHNLESLLFPNEDVIQMWKRVSQNYSVHHPVSTRRTVKDDLCRQILLQSCGTSQSSLRQSITRDSDSSLTKLYRGFSKFMFEDLETQQETQSISRSKRKKHAESVAFEMMRRNQAYSHLVEMVMPRHIRLSIHAHNNFGPKFAISLLPSSRFRYLGSLDAGHLDTIKDACEEKHLHIPTPWHNVLVEIQGYTYVFVCKAAMVRSELDRVGCPWDASSGYDSQHPRGGRYMLRLKLSSTTSAQ